MASYKIHSQTLPKLCDSCLLRVSTATMEDKEVILVLAQLGTSFCSILSKEILTPVRQQIHQARSDGEALHFIRDALHNSLDPHMIDKLLDVLSMEEIGKSLHVEEIRKVYHRNIMAHKLCKNCKKDDTNQQIEELKQCKTQPPSEIKDTRYLSHRVESVFQPNETTEKKSNPVESVKHTSETRVRHPSQTTEATTRLQHVESAQQSSQTAEPTSLTEIFEHTQHPNPTEPTLLCGHQSIRQAIPAVPISASQIVESLKQSNEKIRSAYPPYTVSKQITRHHEFTLPEFLHEKCLPFRISYEAESYYFPEDNITVVIPPNTLPHTEEPRMAYITPENHSPHRKHAMSKIYKFSPSGLKTQNRMMVVFPLFDSHSYDYNNMTLMYKKNKESNFVCADSMTDHKPTWLFHRNSCYLFLNHFCRFYAHMQTDEESTICPDALLLYRHIGENLEINLTFGCLKKTCGLFSRNVIEHFVNKGFTEVTSQPTYIAGRTLTVMPSYSQGCWAPQFNDDGNEKISTKQLRSMCVSERNDMLPVNVIYRFKHRQGMQEHQDIGVRYSDEEQSRTLSFNMADLAVNGNTEDNTCRRMTWSNVEYNGEIKEVFHMHASPDNMAQIINSKPTFKEQVEVFLDSFIAGYTGPKDVMYIMQSLILHTKQHPSLHDVQINLKWLKVNKMLLRKLYDLCNEKEMSGFLTYSCEEIPVPLEQYPDTFSKLMHLTGLCLNNSAYYTTFKSYCEGRPALKKYVIEDISPTSEMIGYNRQQYKLPEVSDECLLKIANSTLKDQCVIDTIYLAGKSFCAHLNYDIICHEQWQKIDKAEGDSQSLGHIREALYNSIVPEKIDQVLNVWMSVKKLGKDRHFEKVKEVYHEKIASHKPCEECNRASEHASLPPTTVKNTLAEGFGTHSGQRHQQPCINHDRKKNKRRHNAENRGGQGNQSTQGIGEEEILNRQSVAHSPAVVGGEQSHIDEPVHERQVKRQRLEETRTGNAASHYGYNTTATGNNQ